MLANGGALMAMIREELTFFSDGERHAMLGYTLLQAIRVAADHRHGPRLDWHATPVDFAPRCVKSILI